MNIHASSAGGESETVITDAATAATQATEISPSTESTNVSADANTSTQSSSVEEGAKPATLEEVIRTAAAETEGTAPASPASEGSEENKGNAAVVDGAETAPQTEAKKPDETPPPFHNHPRWKEKEKQVKELGATVEKLTSERDTFKQGYEESQAIQTYMGQNHLSVQDVADGFKIMALIRQDPEAALESLGFYVEQLELVTGRRLPADLNEKVEQGLVDPEVAKELSLKRLKTNQLEATVVSVETDRYEQQNRQAVAEIQSTVTAVEQSISSNDPDYARKQPFIMDRVRVLIAERQPRTPEAAAQIVRDAHAEVSDRMKPIVGQRRPVQTMVSGNTSSDAKPVPKTLFDVVRNSLA